MAEIDELKAKLTNIRTKTQQIADNLNVPYTDGEMTLTEIGNLLEDIEEHGGGGSAITATVTTAPSLAATMQNYISATVSLEV